MIGEPQANAAADHDRVGALRERNVARKRTQGQAETVERRDARLSLAVQAAAHNSYLTDLQRPASMAPSAS